MKRFLLVATLCCLVSATVALAQIATTSLRGVIKDPSGALVAGASITLTDPANGTTYHAVSDNSGFYVFPAVAPAHYGIAVAAAGFATENSSITLLVSQPATVNFALTVSRANVTVTVNSAATTLNLTDATEGNAVGNAVIESLPMDERNPISLLSLQPGVLYIGQDPSTADSRQGAVAGGRSDQGNITLDGLDDNDEIFGTAFTGILRSTLDSTEEFRVVTSNGTAEAGRSSGAQIDLITKSGTNSYHGALYEYYRPDNVVANNYFNKYSELSSGVANDPEFYLVNTFGGALGGPIKRDKLFYFFNYEGQRTGTHQVVGATLPTASFMLGELEYQDVNGNTETLSPTQVAAMDTPCLSQSFNGQPVCPNGPGPNAAILSYYAQAHLVANGNALGDGGYNSGSYFFTSPAPSTLNTSILKVDYAMNPKNHFFVRGNLQKDTTDYAENLPGEPSKSDDDNSKGLAAGYTWIPSSTIVNDLRYAYVRQGFQITGVGQRDAVDVYGLTQPIEICNCDTLRHVPVNEITDTLNWTKGSHTFAFGGNWRMITNQFGTDSNSFNGAETNPLYENTKGLPYPANISTSFAGGSWPEAWGNLMGDIPEETQVYNFHLTSPTSGTALPDGAFVNRNYRANEFEYFLQDTWHARSNLSVILGMRHTLLQTPYETNGQQVSPTINMDKWYKERESEALQGQVYEPLLSLTPSGKVNHMPGYWPRQKDNIAPRIGVVFAPDPKTSIRASAGIYYDHFGEALINDFDEFGSAGLATTTTNPADSLGFEDSPRFTGPYNLPAFPASDFPPVANPQTFPYTPNPLGFQIYWGIDNVMKTPYAEAFNLSLQHQFAGGWTFEQAYVGRLGRHLLQQLDLAEPVDYVDPNGGGDYFAAAKILSKLVDASPGLNGVKVNNNVAPIPYFEHVFPYMKSTDYAGENATQAIFNNAWAPTRYYGGETLALAILDDFGIFPGSPNSAPGAPTSTFWADQFSSLYALSTIGNSSYNALQATLRHPASHGLTLDFSYTFAKSLDLESETERGDIFTNEDNGYVDFGIQNTWNPKLNKAVSDFDTHSLFTADWIYALPVGQGKAVLGGANHFTDAFIGGWQWAGLARVTSGLPFTLLSQGYPTNYENPGWGIAQQPIVLKKTFVDGVPYAIDRTTAANINSGIFTGMGPIRYPYAGEAGERNFFRGDGYFDIDSSLTKSWNLADKAQVKFAGEVYNITNSNRFDVSPAGLYPQLSFANLGAYSSTLSTYRRIQLGLRMDF
jgi:hypothetical protein